MNKSPKQVERVKAYVVLLNGVLLHDGWGTRQSWVFRHKWVAKEAIEEEKSGGEAVSVFLGNKAQIVPCTLTYTPPAPLLTKGKRNKK